MAAVTVAGACGGSSDNDDDTSASPTPTTAEAPSADDPDDTGNGDAGHDAEPDDDTGSGGGDLTPADEATPFECVDDAVTVAETGRGVTDDTISIGFMHADLSVAAALNLTVDLGPEGDHLQAMFDDLNERCGGIRGRRVVVNTYEFSPIDPGQMDAACTRATVDDENLFIVGRALLGEGPLCITETHAQPYLALLGVPGSFLERSDGRMFTLDGNLDRSLATTVPALMAIDAIDADDHVGVVWGDTTDQNVTVTEALLPSLDAAGITWTDALLPETTQVCSGYAPAVDRLRDAGVEVVIATLGVLCYPAFVLEATNQGWFPRYVAPEFANIDADLAAQRMADAGDGFDGAIGLSYRPNNRDPEGTNPNAWDAHCYDLVATRVDLDWSYPDVRHGANADLCSAAWLINEAAQRAGDTLTHESMVAAMETIDRFPVSADRFGTFSPDKHWGAVDEFFELRWTAACTCWRLTSGPIDVAAP